MVNHTHDSLRKSTGYKLCRFGALGLYAPEFTKLGLDPTKNYYFEKHRVLGEKVNGKVLKKGRKDSPFVFTEGDNPLLCLPCEDEIREKPFDLKLLKVAAENPTPCHKEGDKICDCHRKLPLRFAPSAKDDRVQGAPCHLASCDEMEILEEFSPQQTKKMLTGSVKNIESGCEKWYFEGSAHRDERVGPQFVTRRKDHLLSDFGYKNRGEQRRSEGPCGGSRMITSASTPSLNFRLLFHGCKWIPNSFRYSLTLGSEADVEALVAPAHEWDEKTCGEGDCWDFSHCPERFGIFGLKRPPKSFFNPKNLDPSAQFKTNWDREGKTWKISCVSTICAFKGWKPDEITNRVKPTNGTFHDDDIESPILLCGCLRVNESKTLIENLRGNASFRFIL